MKLKKLQNDFVQAIYNPKETAILDYIKKKEIDPKELFDIYRNNVLSTLTDSLRITYNHVYEKLGDKQFKKIAHEYITKNRSKSGNLDDYGANFANFLKKKKIKNNNYLYELANLEWHLHLAYLAKDTSGIAIDKLQKLDQEKLFKIKFKLHPSCYLLKSGYNLIFALKGNKKIIKKSIYILVSRATGEALAETISKKEFEFLKAASNAKTLYQIYTKHKIDIQNCLQKFINNKTLDQFYF